MMSSRTVMEYALIASLAVNAGCASIWHELKPYRLHRLNRGPAPSLDPGFMSYKSKSQMGLVKQIPPAKHPTVSVNSAEVVTVRAQSPVIE